MNIKRVLLPLTAAVLVACGGGGGGGGSKGAAPSGVGGVGATGAPFASGTTVEAFCANGGPFSAQIGGLTGSPLRNFLIPAPESALPCVLVANLGDTTLYSVAQNKRANITPLTNLAVRRAAVLAGISQNLDDVELSSAAVLDIADADGVAVAVGEVVNTLTNKQFAPPSGIAIDFFTRSFRPAPGDAYDDLLERLKTAFGANSEQIVDDFVQNGESAESFPQSSATENPDTPPDDGQTPGGGGSPNDGGGTPGGGTSNPPVSSTLTRTLDSCSLDQKTSEDVASKGMKISEASLLQVVQMDAGAGSNPTIVSGKEVLVRIDMTASTAGIALPTSGKLGVHNPTTGECLTINLVKTADSTGKIPTSVQPRTLKSSLVGTIPASSVKSGMSILAVADTAQTITKSEADVSYISLRPQVISQLSEVVHVYKLSVGGQAGYFPTPTKLEDLLKRFTPLSTVSVEDEGVFQPESVTDADYTKNGDFYTGTQEQGLEILAEFSNFCESTYGTTEFTGYAAREKCVLMTPDNLDLGFGGVAQVNGNSALSQSFSEPRNFFESGPYFGGGWIDPRAQVFLHEFAHVYSLNHANCGNPPLVDSRLYSDGRLGNMGFYDHGLGFFVTNRGYDGTGDLYSDITSYCSNGLLSDIGYNLMATYKLSGNASTSTAAARRAGGDRQFLMISRVGDGYRGKVVGRLPAKSMIASEQVTQSLSEIASGKQVRVIGTHDGENPYGPFFVEVTATELDALKSKLGDTLRLIERR